MFNVLRDMGSSGDVTNGSSSDLLAVIGDQNVSIRQLMEEQEEEDVILEHVEIVDSESDSGEDPLRTFVEKRSKTAPSVHKDFQREREKSSKRSRTEPSEHSTKRSKEPPKDLLSFLLPDNYDISLNQSDFSLAGSSTQITAQTSVLETTRIFGDGDKQQEYEEDLTNNNTKHKILKSTGDNQSYTFRIFGSQSEDEKYHGIQSKERESNENEDVSEENGDREPSSDEEKNSKSNSSEKSMKRSQPFSNEVVFEPSIIEAIEISNDGSSVTKIIKDTTILKEEKVSSANVNKSQEKPPLERPVRRKSTLVSMCQNRNPVPYRVGLSKRANITHLHSYLSKK